MCPYLDLKFKAAGVITGALGLSAIFPLLAAPGSLWHVFPEKDTMLCHHSLRYRKKYIKNIIHNILRRKNYLKEIKNCNTQIDFVKCADRLTPFLCLTQPGPKSN